MVDKMVRLLAGVLGLLFGYVLVQDQNTIPMLTGCVFLFLSTYVLLDLVIRAIVSIVSKLRKR